MRTYASQLFDELNSKYWRGRLPRYRVIERAKLSACLGRCDNTRRTILLAPHPSAEELRLTLLHEMCHIGTGPGYDHGPRFLRKLRRLVRLGETKLVEEDIERYDGTAVKRAIEAARAAGHFHFGNEISLRAALRSDIESLAIGPELRVRWPRVARYLAQRYHMTISQLRRAAPWAERVWREQTALARQERQLREQFAARRREPGE
jgi:hypothetical protein